MKSTHYDISHISKTVASGALSREIEAATIALARFDERLARAIPVLADGVKARGHFLEAQALIGLSGGLAPLEDLVLHDASMNVRTPTLEIIRAVSILCTRRSLARRNPETVLEPAHLRTLLGISTGGEDQMPAGLEDKGLDEGFGDKKQQVSPSWETSQGVTGSKRNASINPWDMPRFEEHEEPDDDRPDEELEPLDRGHDDNDANFSGEAGDGAARAFADVDALLARTQRSIASFNDLSAADGRQKIVPSDPAYGQARRLKAWLTPLDETADQPTVLAAAIALDAWLLLEPSEHNGQLGFVLAATVLRQRRLAANHLPVLAAGLRKSAQGKPQKGLGSFRWQPDIQPEARIAGLLGAITHSANLGHADLDRLTLARELMLRKCVGKSKNSRLVELVDLFVATPLVTVQMAAKALKVSPQGVDAMLAELGASLPREFTGRKRYRAWGIV